MLKVFYVVQRRNGAVNVVCASLRSQVYVMQECFTVGDLILLKNFAT